MHENDAKILINIISEIIFQEYNVFSDKNLNSRADYVNSSYIQAFF